MSFRTIDVLNNELSKLPPGNPDAVIPDVREIEIVIESGYGALEVKGTSARQAIERYLSSVLGPNNSSSSTRPTTIPVYAAHPRFAIVRALVAGRQDLKDWAAGIDTVQFAEKEDAIADGCRIPEWQAEDFPYTKLHLLTEGYSSTFDYLQHCQFISRRSIRRIFGDGYTSGVHPGMVQYRKGLRAAIVDVIEFLETLVSLFRCIDVRDVCETVFRGRKPAYPTMFPRALMAYDVDTTAKKKILEQEAAFFRYCVQFAPGSFLLRDSPSDPAFMQYAEKCIARAHIDAFDNYNPAGKEAEEEKEPVTIREALEVYRSPSSYTLPEIVPGEREVEEAVQLILGRQRWMTVGTIASSRVNYLIQRYCSRAPPRGNIADLLEQCRKYILSNDNAVTLDVGPIATHFVLENNPGWGKIHTSTPLRLFTRAENCIRDADDLQWIGFAIKPTGAYLLQSFFEREPGLDSSRPKMARPLPYKLTARHADDWPFHGNRGVLVRIVDKIWQKNETIDTFIHALINTVRRNDTFDVRKYPYTTSPDGLKITSVSEKQLIQNILIDIPVANMLAYIDGPHVVEYATVLKTVQGAELAQKLAELGCKNIAVAEKILRHSRWPLACSIAVRSAHRIAHLLELPTTLSVSSSSVEHIEWANGYLLKAATRAEFGTSKISPLSTIFLAHLTRGVWAISPFAEALLSLNDQKTVISSSFLSSPAGAIDILHRSFLLDTPNVLVDANKIVYAVDPSLLLMFDTRGIEPAVSAKEAPITFEKPLQAEPVDVKRSFRRGKDKLESLAEWACVTEVYRQLQLNGFSFATYILGASSSSSHPGTKVLWSKLGEKRWTYCFVPANGNIDIVHVEASRGTYVFKRNL